MSFNENTFMIAGTFIAIAGVGLYIWDTRGKAMASSVASGVSSGYTSLTNPSANSNATANANYISSVQDGTTFGGKSRKRKQMHRRKHGTKKSKKH